MYLEADRWIAAGADPADANAVRPHKIVPLPPHVVGTHEDGTEVVEHDAWTCTTCDLWQANPEIAGECPGPAVVCPTCREPYGMFECPDGCPWEHPCERDDPSPTGAIGHTPSS